MPFFDLEPELIKKEKYPCVLPHDDGMLLIRGEASFKFTFQWHEVFEGSPGSLQIPWPFLEIRKSVVDSDGILNAATHFIPADALFSEVNGRRAYLRGVFLELAANAEMRYLTGSTRFYSDVRELLLFQLYESSRWESRVCSHFDKHSGGDLRLIGDDHRFFLEARLGYLDDRISDELISPDEPVYLETYLDLWSTFSHARTPEEYTPWDKLPLGNNKGKFPTVFSRCEARGEAQPGVTLLREDWTPTRVRELLARLGSKGEATPRPDAAGS